MRCKVDRKALCTVVGKRPCMLYRSPGECDWRACTLRTGSCPRAYPPARRQQERPARDRTMSVHSFQPCGVKHSPYAVMPTFWTVVNRVNPDNAVQSVIYIPSSDGFGSFDRRVSTYCRQTCLCSVLQCIAV